MASRNTRAAQISRLDPKVNRILYVRNLPFNTTGEELYALFGKYGAIRQVRLGAARTTKGTAYVCFEDVHDAKAAADHLSGFNVGNRYLIVLYFNAAKQHKQVGGGGGWLRGRSLAQRPSRPRAPLLLDPQVSLKQQEADLRKLQEAHGVGGEQQAGGGGGGG